jgi:flagellar biosynthesis protein FlhG
VSRINRARQEKAMSHIYTIGGGKGGVGKSFITANLGVLCAKLGHRVLLVDLDLGGSNLHTFLGLKDPQVGLHDFLSKRCPILGDTAAATGIPNLSIICSTHCSLEAPNLFYAQKLKIINAIKKLPYDYILLDLGAGSDFNTLDFFLSSDEGMFIFTPEPTSVENTLRFIKALYYRRLKQILKQKAFNDIVGQFTAQSGGSGTKLSELMEFMMTHNRARGELLQARLRDFDFKMVLNQYRKQVDPTLGKKIEKVCNKHFYSRFQFLGMVSYDERVHDAVFAKKLYITKYPYTHTATDLQNIAKKLTITPPLTMAAATHRS